MRYLDRQSEEDLSIRELVLRALTPERSPMKASPGLWGAHPTFVPYSREDPSLERLKQFIVSFLEGQTGDRF